MFGQYGLGHGALQCQQGAICDFFDMEFGFQMRAQMGNIGCFARCINDHKNVIAAVCKHQIIQNTAGIIGKEPIALATFGQTLDIHRDQSFQGARG